MCEIAGQSNQNLKDWIRGPGLSNPLRLDRVLVAQRYACKRGPKESQYRFSRSYPSPSSTANQTSPPDSIMDLYAWPVPLAPHQMGSVRRVTQTQPATITNSAKHIGAFV